MRRVQVRPYPWNALELVPRAAIRRLAALRQTDTLVPEELAGALSALVGARVEVSLSSLSVGAPRKQLFELGLAWEGCRVTLGVEPALATALLERILARPFALTRAHAELDPTAAGAVSALAVEVARRLTRAPVSLATPLAPSHEQLLARATVLVDDRPFAAYALVATESLPTRVVPRANLGLLGDVPLAVPLVVAVSLATRAELARLAPGTAFMPGEKAWVDARGRGRGVLVAATLERGVWVELPPDGRVVLRGETAELSPDSADSGDQMVEPNELNDTLTDAALEAPVVVRVELGTVSLSAGEWAALKSGDVLETGRRIAEPVLLRVAGRVVARGELVDVDGEVGVRVRELIGNAAER